MPLKYGQQAPLIESKALWEDPFDLTAYRGKIVVLHFYTSWCRHCIRSMGDFDKLQTKYKDKVVVVGISLDKAVEEFNKFITNNPSEHQHIFDGPWKKSKTAKDYRVVNVPTSMIIDAEGNIQQIDLFGAVLAKYVQKLIDTESTK